MAASRSSGFNFGGAAMTALALIIASPVLLVLVLLFGAFMFGSMISIIGNLFFLGTVIFFDVIFYAADRLKVTSVIFGGVAVGMMFWLIGLVALFSGPLGAICQIPLLGTLVCGGISLASVFTNLLGYVFAGVIVSGLVGGFLLLIGGGKK